MSEEKNNYLRKFQGPILLEKVVELLESQDHLFDWLGGGGGGGGGKQNFIAQKFF